MRRFNGTRRGRLKVVVTGGHPGDPEYGWGGTIARHADLGHDVTLRTAEATKASGILKARAVFASQIDGEATVWPARLLRTAARGRYLSCVESGHAHAEVYGQTQGPFTLRHRPQASTNRITVI